MFEIHIDPKDEARVRRALAIAPQQMETQLADAFDHIKRKYFKTLPGVSRLRPHRQCFFRIVMGYINRAGGNLERLSFKLVTYWRGAKIQEYGGTKRAKSGKYMTIPIGGALTSSGMVKREYRKAREVTNTFTVQRNGRLIVFRRMGHGRRSRIIPLYLLKESVQLQPRLAFGQAWDVLGAFRIQRISLAADRALKAVANA